jgi:hypothetical protein
MKMYKMHRPKADRRREEGRCLLKNNIYIYMYIYIEKFMKTAQSEEVTQRNKILNNFKGHEKLKYFELQ